MAASQPPPDLNIPHSSSTVEISIIDTTSYLTLPSSLFMQPELPNFNTLTAPCYSFLIKHHSPAKPNKHDTLIFDLGVREDFENSPTSIVEQFAPFKDGIRIEKDVATILRENNQPLSEIGAIIWSHWHLDHTGDPATFPSATDLIVGPGFKSAFVPGFPTVADSPVDEKAWQNRSLIEVDFSSISSESSDGLRIGKFRALDFYGDGSFFLLDTPGHAIGHLCALARTTADPPTFMFLGGDIAHHAGEFRPTRYLPLPSSISPSPLQPPFQLQATFCPGEVFEAIHPKNSRTEPFFSPSTEGVHLDVAEAKQSIEKMTEYDAYENVFSVISHDRSLFDVVDFYPKPANQWKEKGWEREGRWRFLGELGAEVGKEGEK
ncbi:hypothetical protein E2P81_ATG10565 [Venturia nashicola]|nr:hypothetical protein E2P81_ATG10565 [Venturia nashicola]